MKSKYTKIATNNSILLLLAFCAFFLTTLNSFDHLLDHKNSTDDSACLVCLNTLDYIDTVAVDVTIHLPLTKSSCCLNLTASIVRTPLKFYFSRAPPSFV